MSIPEHFPPISDSRLTCITPTGSYTKSDPNNQLTIETIKIRNRSDSSALGSNDRSYRSKESNSSSSQSCNAVGHISSRSKSLGTNDRENSANSKNSAKLETLFENRNGMSNGRSQRVPSQSYKRVNSHSTVSSKPPLKKALGHSASDGQLVPVERTNSKEQITHLRRNNSDQRLNLAGGKQLKNFKTRGRSVSVERTESGRNKNNQFGGMRRTSSSLVINSSQYGGTMRDDYSYRTGDDDFRETANVKDKDKRIIDWLLGVHDVADVPPDPVIEYVDEPPQTDTAVHIIYGKHPSNVHLQFDDLTGDDRFVAATQRAKLVVNVRELLASGDIIPMVVKANPFNRHKEHFCSSL